MKYFTYFGLILISLTPIAISFLKPYQKARILTFLDPSRDPLGAGYQITQSKIAIGSGGFFGKGFLNGSQSYLDYLPEKHTDFIFTLFSEEFGFFGSSVVLALYVVMTMRIVSIGNILCKFVLDVDLIKNRLSNISIASNSLLLIIVTNLLFFNLDSNIIFPKKFKES